MTPKLAGAFVSGTLVLVSLAAVYIALGYGVIDDDGRIDAGFLPVVTATIVAIAGVIDIVSRLRGVTKDSMPKAVREDIDIFGRTQKQRDRQLVLVIVLLVVALLLIDVLGFLLAFGALIVAVSFFVEKKKIVSTLLIASSSIFVAWLVFDQFLQVPLPNGIFGA